MKRYPKKRVCIPLARLSFDWILKTAAKDGTYVLNRSNIFWSIPKRDIACAPAFDCRSFAVP